MAKFQWMTGENLPTSITTVVNSSMSLKLVPDPGELVPIPIILTPPHLAVVQDENVRKGPNFTTFKLAAKAVGSARLSAEKSANKLIAGPIAITIEARVSLPAASTDQGLLARLLLAETPPPIATTYNFVDAEKAMIWMRVVVSNRLAKPSVKYASAGAKSINDVIRAKGQFAGFEDYPTLPGKISSRIDEFVAIANDGSDRRRDRYKKFVDIALRVAAMAAVKDPSSTGLYFWRTTDHGSPSAEAKEYEKLMGNTFFTL